MIFFSGSSYLSDAFERYLKDLQTYVDVNRVAATDTLKIQRWAHRQHFAHFIIEREEGDQRFLLYDDSYDESVILDRAYSETGSVNWMHFRPVRFVDGNAEVLLDMAVNRLSEGDMDTDIPVTGSNETMHLGAGLDQMRRELLQKAEIERKMRSSQEKLLLGMAHDLRNPLTGLMAYLEIVKDESLSKEGSMYVRRALDKTIQIRDLSEQLFDYFLIHSAPRVELEEPEYVQFVLEDYLSEMATVLEKKGFAVDAERLNWENVQIRVNHNYLGRIFFNLVSNMEKYADIAYPVRFISSCTNAHFKVVLQNVPRLASETTVKGTKIGVANIIGMMDNMDAQCKIVSNESIYETQLIFNTIEEKKKVRKTSENYDILSVE